jgi:hypothetical protein
MEADTRLWMYKAGEARLFDHPDDVPAGDGWQRFPLSGDGTVPLSETLSAAEPEPRLRPKPPGADSLGGMTRQRLMQVAARHGIRIDFRWTKAQLKHAIIEVQNDNGP